MNDESTRKTCKKCKWFKPMITDCWIEVGRCFRILRMGHDGLEPTKTFATDACSGWVRPEGGEK